jgi:hypothetical protein
MPSDIQPHSRTGTLLGLAPGATYTDTLTLRVPITAVSSARRRLIALWSMAACRAAVANPRGAWSSKTDAALVGPDQADVTITITRTQ